MDSRKRHCTDGMKAGRRIVYSSRGVALLMTMWLMVVLSVMAFSFSSLVRTETHSALAFKEGMEMKYYAEAGIARGISELFYRMAVKVNIIPEPVEEKDALFRVDGASYVEKIGDGFYRVSISEEGGKINLNTLSDSTGIFLHNLLMNMGVDRERADGIVDAILDWKDEDNDVRLKGAENDYYMSLPSPYKARNGAFEALEELALVKGIDPDLLYGDAEKKGIIHYLTIYHKTPQLNMGAAPVDVLRAIPGMTPEILDGIVSARKFNDLDAIREYQNIIANKYQAIMPYLGAEEANIYTINAVGYKDNEKKGFPVVATVVLKDNGQYVYRYYKSPGYVKP